MLNQNYAVETPERPERVDVQDYDESMQGLISYCYEPCYSIERAEDSAKALLSATQKNHKIITTSDGCFLAVLDEEPPHETSTAETPDPTEFQNKINGNTYANIDAVIEAADFSDRSAANQQPAYDYTPEPPPYFDEIPARQNATKMQSIPFKAMPLAELMAKEYRENWLIQDLFSIQDIILIFGNSASGKSLIVQDMCYCTAAGIDFHGKKTKQGKVVYIAGEGQLGLQKRFKALRTKYNCEAHGLFISEQPAALMSTQSAKDVRELIDLIGDVSLVVIDTLHRNFGSGDENLSRDFGIFLNNIDTYIKSSGAAVLIIHHSGNDVKDRSRGSSSIKAAMDVEYCVTKDPLDGSVMLTNTKMKDFDPPKPMAFKIEKLEQSVILEPTEFTAKKATKALSKNASKSLQALRKTINDDGISPPKAVIELFTDSPQNIPTKVVTIEQWRVLAYDAITVDSDAKDAIKKAFQRARTELENTGDIGIHGSYAWLAYAENNNHID